MISLTEKGSDNYLEADYSLILPVCLEALADNLGWSKMRYSGRSEES